MSDAQIIITVKYDATPIGVIRLMKDLEDNYMTVIEDVDVRVD